MKRKNYKGRVIMINLVIKDFLLQKKYFLFFLVYGVLIAFSAGRVSEITASFLYVFYLITVTYISIMYANGFETRGKSETMLVSLPINRNTVVASKYLFLLVMIIMYSIALWIFTFLVRIADYKVMAIFNLKLIIIAFIIIGIAFAIYYPLYFKLGRQKLRIVTMFFYLLLFTSPKLCEKFAESYRIERLKRIVPIVENNILLVTIIMILITMLIMFISLNVSIGIYNKKEL